MEIPILYQDEDILLIDKPPGIPTQPTVDKRRPNIFDLIKQQLKTERIYLHHRLDRDTSGVLMLSLSGRANKPLTDMFKEHAFTKIYLAICKAPQSEDSSTPSLQDSWIVKNHLVKRRLGSQAVKVFRTSSGGDYAETHFQLLERSHKALLVQAQPLTGRTHQIRVHCLNSGSPILGDSMYGGKDPRVPRLMLHAETLSFRHPITLQQMRITSPRPKDFTKVWENLQSASE